MCRIKVALLQIKPAGDTRSNALKGAEYCRRARDMGADIALFPEMFSCGYDICSEPAEKLKDSAVLKDGRFVTSFSSLAQELEMAIGITFLEKREGAPANSFALFDRFGNLALEYSKVHTCDFGAEAALSGGDGFPVCDLNTAAGVIKTGAMICFDREFPESARILMLGGAELILVPNACPMEVNRLSQLRARAFENMVGIATCNYPAGVPDCNGHSTVFDGMAWRGSGDMLILEAGEEEGVFCAEIDVGALREYRKSEVLGNAYRRPKLYKKLTEEEVLPPFVRGDARR